LVSSTCRADAEPAEALSGPWSAALKHCRRFKLF
jgi:hypothetical protein